MLISFQPTQVQCSDTQNGGGDVGGDVDDDGDDCLWADFEIPFESHQLVIYFAKVKILERK